MPDFFELHRWLGRWQLRIEQARFRRFRTLGADEVAKRSARLAGCSLYHFQISPYATRVRSELARLQVEIPMFDVLEEPKAYADLMAGGKIDQVPCLRIAFKGEPERWLYESKDIITFLRSNLNSPTSMT